MSCFNQSGLAKWLKHETNGTKEKVGEKMKSKTKPNETKRSKAMGETKQEKRNNRYFELECQGNRKFITMKVYYIYNETRTNGGTKRIETLKKNNDTMNEPRRNK